MIRTAALADIAPQPWKNGGGLTRDLLAWPSASNWQLRISVAEVARSGPFSPYPGVSRHFAVLQGAGVVLEFADGPHRLVPGSLPLHFDGAAAPACELIAGETLDLNLLAIKAAGAADMAPVRRGSTWAGTAPLRAVFTALPSTLVIAGRAVADLPAMSLAWTDAASPGAWQLDGAAAQPQAWWLSFTPHAR
jgi:environmental stress-induced protein Ves